MLRPIKHAVEYGMQSFREFMAISSSSNLAGGGQPNEKEKDKDSRVDMVNGWLNESKFSRIIKDCIGRSMSLSAGYLKMG